MMCRATIPSLLVVSITLVLSSILAIKVDVVYGRKVGACYFAFGDSYSEAGNNNALQTIAKANYLPYGIDFFGGIPTGRFTNGLIYVDILTQLVGVDHLLPPFNGLTQHDILEDGVNYASGSAGLLPESGRQFGMNIWLGQQIENHKFIVSRINGSSSMNHLHKCLYTINIGTNDYINNYFIPQYYNTSKYYTLEQFTTLLVRQYASHIKDLHDLGARKIAIYGLGYLGCAPAMIGTNGTDSSVCVEKVNSAVLMFNHNLVKLIDELNCKFKDSKFTYINTTSIIPFTGFKVINESCCPVTSVNLCQPQSTPCSNRDEYYFWDDFHYTQRVNVISGRRSYNAQDPTDAYPVDIKHLLRIT